MFEVGDMTIVTPPWTKVKGSYLISADDGRVCVNGWKEFMEKEEFFKVGDNMLFLLHLGTGGPFLFVSEVPYIPLE